MTFDEVYRREQEITAEIARLRATNAELDELVRVAARREAEICRIRAVNAELVELVQDYAEWLDDAGETGDAAWDARYRERRRRIAATLAAAEGVSRP
jgi:hypothetical protein